MNSSSSVRVPIVITLLAVTSIAVLGLRGTAEPDTQEPTLIERSTTAMAAPTEPPNARVVPEAPSAVPADAWITTESGLRYADLKIGEGDAPSAGNTVIVEYAGWLEDGTLFDSSYKRADSFSFNLGKGRVIKGWDEGVATMAIGGKRQLIVPSNLGYGERGAGGMIPPGATLVFEVELLEIVKPPTPHAVPAEAWQVSSTGLKTYDIVVGEGAEAKAGDKTALHYRGWLEDGTMFDSSHKRNQPIDVAIATGQVIPAWDEAVVGMKVGGKRSLLAPPELAYKDRGFPGLIPPNATLRFDVELVSVQSAAPSAP
jgi:peptidylprolyl isomerase